jgi:hypothetical protein
MRRTSSTFACDIEIPVSRSVNAMPMASTGLSRRVEQVVRYSPLSEMSARQRRECHVALLDAATFEDLSG